MRERDRFSRERPNNLQFILNILKFDFSDLSFLHCICLFIKPVRAVPAATLTAIAAFEMEFFGKAFVAFGSVIKIFAFDGFIFVILLIHTIQI